MRKNNILSILLITISLLSIAYTKVIHASPQCITNHYKDKSGTIRENTGWLYGSCNCSCTHTRTANNRCVHCGHSKYLTPHDSPLSKDPRWNQLDATLAAFSNYAQNWCTAWKKNRIKKNARTYSKNKTKNYKKISKARTKIHFDQ